MQKSNKQPASYFEHSVRDFNPYQVHTIYPPVFDIFGSLTFHELMLADAARVNPYKEAVERFGAAQPQTDYVDVGSGLGTLALICSKFGNAKQVFAIEREASIFELSKQVVKAQSAEVSRKIKFLHGSSFKLKLPKKAGALITETIGNFGIEEGIVPLINDAKKRFLKKDATIIPAELEFFIAPIESERCYRRVGFWDSNRYGIDLSVLSKHALSRLYHHRVLVEEFLGEPVSVGRLLLEGPRPIKNQLELSGECVSLRQGTLHGFVGWFRACLYDDVYLSNDPRDPSGPFNWTQVYFPVSPITLTRGQRIDISIQWDLKTNDVGWGFRSKL